jgi:hypothetical protein
MGQINQMPEVKPMSCLKVMICLSVLLLIDSCLIGNAHAEPKVIMAQALPNTFGPQVDVVSHLGSVAVSLSAKPLGKTTIVGEIEYWASPEDKETTKKQFYGDIQIRTGKVVGVVKVRFKGIPLGSAVEVTVK